MTLEPRFTRYLREVNRQRQQVASHPALGPCDKLLWMRLRDEQMMRGALMRISVTEMATLTGVSPRHIHRSLLALQNAGLLRRTADNGVLGTVEVLSGTRRARVMVREARRDD